MVGLISVPISRSTDQGLNPTDNHCSYMYEYVCVAMQLCIYMLVYIYVCVCVMCVANTYRYWITVVLIITELLFFPLIFVKPRTPVEKYKYLP